MAKVSIWMPDYIGDHLRDCARLTHEQHSVYVYLRMEYWNGGGSLPDDDSVLSMIAKLPLDRWIEQRHIHEKFYEIEGGFWRHSGLDAELEKAKKRSQKASQAGKKGGRPRKDKKPQENPGAFLGDKLGENPAEKPQRKPQKSTSPSPSQERIPLAGKNKSMGRELNWGGGS